MFERMEISESIYEGVVEPSYKKNTRSDANRAGHISNKIGKAALSKTHPVTGGGLASDVKNMHIA